MSIDATEQIEKFQEFYELNYKDKLQDAVSRGDTFLVIDFKELSMFDAELAEQLLDYPEETIKAAEKAVEHYDTSKTFRIRFRDISESQTVLVRNIRAFHLGKLISIEGIIRQSSEVRPQAVSAKFECPTCGNTLTIAQTETTFKEPVRCSCGRKGHFRLLAKELIDVQRLVIEESPESLEGGAQPKRLQVFLREDLVEPRMEKRTTPGSKVVVSGVVYEVPIPTRTGANSTRFDLAMTVNYIEPIEEDFSEILVDEEDEKEIKRLASDPKIHEKLVNSIAPSIYGHEKIKEAIALQMFGGVRKIKADGTKVRGDMHILAVGDPGVSKSQLLTFVDLVSPKSRYVAGRSASGAGLTATVVKDEFLRGWALEAGAMVLADKGILVLDEMDKISADDTAALHEAMEQQKLSIAKANIQATLRTQTSILAAANPKLGRFNPFNPIAEQIDLPPALISRFDLIFVLRDIPNKELDNMIADRILINQGKSDYEPEISPQLLRKYLAYAKQRVRPALTDEAKNIMQKFYVDIRTSSGEGEGAIKAIPIGPRQLEAAIRLAEASAKVRLSETVDKEDALRALNLLRGCLEKIGVDPETGKMDIDRINTGITASTRGKILVVRDIIYRLDEEGKKTMSIEEDIRPLAEQKGISEQKLDEALEKLRKSGEIFNPKPGFVQKI